MFPARKCCRWSEYKISRCFSEQQSRFPFDRACRHKHYMKIDHTLCFLQYFILRIYHCNEYAYLPNPWTIHKILSRIAGSLQFFHDQEQKNKFRQLFEDESEYSHFHCHCQSVPRYLILSVAVHLYESKLFAGTWPKKKDENGLATWSSLITWCRERLEIRLLYTMSRSRKSSRGRIGDPASGWDYCKPGCRDGTPGAAGIEESIGEQNSYQYFT